MANGVTCFTGVAPGVCAGVEKLARIEAEKHRAEERGVLAEVRGGGALRNRKAPLRHPSSHLREHSALLCANVVPFNASDARMTRTTQRLACRNSPVRSRNSTPSRDRSLMPRCACIPL